MHLVNIQFHWQKRNMWCALQMPWAIIEIASELEAEVS